MNEEYKKLLIKNFYEWDSQEKIIENIDNLEDYLIELWTEATRQADERNKNK